MAEASNWKQKGYDPSQHGWEKADTGGSNFGYPANYYFADTIRAICTAFGLFFNELYVVHHDANGYPIKNIQVPLKFGIRAKSHDFRTEQESGKTYYIQLPNMYYRISGVQFSSERACGLTSPRMFYSEVFERNGITDYMQEQFWGDMQPAPYNFTIQMDAKTENMDDANQILEQILVRFTPEAYLDIKEFWFFNKRRSIKMKLDSTNIQVESESMGEEAKREITVTFQFTIEAFLYKPIQKSTIIDQIVTTLTADNVGLKWENKVIGNYDGSLTNRYDMDKLIGTDTIITQGGEFSGRNVPSDTELFTKEVNYDSKVVNAPYFTSAHTINENS